MPSPSKSANALLYLICAGLVVCGAMAVRHALKLNQEKEDAAQRAAEQKKRDREKQLGWDGRHVEIAVNGLLDDPNSHVAHWRVEGRVLFICFNDDADYLASSELTERCATVAKRECGFRVRVWGVIGGERGWKPEDEPAPDFSH